MEVYGAAELLQAPGQAASPIDPGDVEVVVSVLQAASVQLQAQLGEPGEVQPDRHEHDDDEVLILTVNVADVEAAEVGTGPSQGLNQAAQSDGIHVHENH